MRVGITGSRVLVPGVERALSEMFVLLEPGCEIVVGGCVGVDALAARLLHPGRHVHAILPANRSRVDPLILHHCFTVEEMALGTSYRDRNARLVELADMLLAFPLYAEQDPRSRRSGTWQTVRMARKVRKPVTVYLLGAMR